MTVTEAKGEARAVLDRHHAVGWVVIAALGLTAIGPEATWVTPGARGYLWQALVLAGALGAGAGVLLGAGARPRVEALPGPVLLVAGSGAALVGWAALSTLWSGVSPAQTLPPLALATTTAALGLLPTLATRDDASWSRLLHDGAAATVTGSGIHALLLADHGGRITLPIGAASAAHMPLLIALAVLGPALLRGGSTVAQTVRAALLLVTVGLLAVGSSRVGVVAASVLCLTVAVRVARTDRRLRWPAVGACLTVAGVLVTTTLRLRPDLSLADGARSANHAAALRALLSPPPQLVVGEGLGGLWPWFALETQPPGGRIPTTREIPEGVLLWHPHSLYLEALAELGLVGASLLAVIILTVLLACIVVWRRGDPSAPVALALAMTLAGLAFELLLVRDFPASLLWWLTAAAVLRRADLLGRRSRPLTPSPRARTTGADVARDTMTG